MSLFKIFGIIGIVIGASGLLYTDTFVYGVLLLGISYVLLTDENRRNKNE